MSLTKLQQDVQPRPVAPSMTREERQAALRSALTKLAGTGVFADIADVVAWQRAERADRPLPGRE
ncbi:hypothetical protein [uncultured Thiodictyon sp.]|uniref:hypothetical protein n=1 Tax=uncultured Thiodictyon sp. TaxID=1846217 RepID=UPI0025D059E4|nr:hypothetical protein [uncultured Thiodictyon sp.]